MNIAVIGAGVSGLVAAYRLSAQHQVTLFEANDHLGGHVNTVEVKEGGDTQSIDTGFIVFNDRNYPQFTALLRELEIASQPTEMSFSVQAWTSRKRLPLEYNGTSLNGLFAQRRNLVNPRFFKLLWDIVRFNRHGHAAITRNRSEELAADQTVHEYLQQHRFNDYFARHYLLPMGAAIWSCPLATFGQFPIRFVFQFFFNHGLLDLANRPQWQVIRGGSKTYVQALLARLRVNIRANTPIDSVQREEHQILVKPSKAEAESYDQIVFACHSDQALRLLARPTHVEHEILGAIPYQKNIALLHTDERLMPCAKHAWASWNCRLAAGNSEDACVTYWMNNLQKLPGKLQYFVSLGAEQFVDPGRVLGQYRYDHPVFSAQSESAKSRHAELIEHDRISYAGAYWGNGFHEDGVASAERVAEVMNRFPPMRTALASAHARAM